jgi:probable F420-dependent oxidoreductase
MKAGMKIGIVSINVGGPETAERMVALCQHAEAAGIESVWTFEHVVVPVDYESTYPYARSGKMGIAPEGWFVDPLISLGHVAAATTTIRLGTGVNILPQTNPLLFAKQAASIDVLSGGRLTLGLGIGWLAEEYEAMGTPFQRRGRRFDDYLSAIKKAWSGEVVEHESEFLSWHGFKSYPTPAQKPHPPILIGGTTQKTLERVVNAADGWYAPSDSREELARQIQELRRLATAAGRSPDSLDITINWRFGKHPDALPAYEELGVTRAVVLLGGVGEADPRKAIDVIASRAKL